MMGGDAAVLFAPPCWSLVPATGGCPLLGGVPQAAVVTTVEQLTTVDTTCKSIDLPVA